MKTLPIPINTHFVGRKSELETLQHIATANEASIIITYGRRRIGKTELLEQAFRNRNILKIEGIEGLSEKEQLANAMSQLSVYMEEPLLAKTVIDTWSEFFQILAKYIFSGKWTLYLEELQWLANYEGTLISELKYVWDNFFRHNPELILILCGSAPSFMINQVVHSKALYNRTQYELPLKEFNLMETKEFLKHRSDKEVLDAYLTIGGIPEYLKWVNKDSSVFLSLINNSFKTGSFFSREYERIFTSNMSSNKHYKDIIELLSKKRFVTRKELSQSLKITSGGGLTEVLTDLENTGFVSKYAPFNLNNSTILTRYAILDNYLQFYFKFIKPISKNVENGDYNQNPQSALKTDTYTKWLGFAFERFCRRYHRVIAKILGFSAVEYTSGAFFSRATDRENPGYQIDLVFDRADKVYTICEIKYTQRKIGTTIIDEFEKKLQLFPNKKNKTIHKVLICNEGSEQALLDYFDAIITRKELFNPNYW